MTKHKIADLTGAHLDAAVAKAEGQLFNMHSPAGCQVPNPDGTQRLFTPSTDWGQGGPIIERERIGLLFIDEGPRSGQWMAVEASDDDGRPCGNYDGPTPLVAAMRSHVASKLGAEVEL